MFLVHGVDQGGIGPHGIISFDGGVGYHVVLVCVLRFWLGGHSSTQKAQNSCSWPEMPVQTLCGTVDLVPIPCGGICKGGSSECFWTG